MSRHCSVFGTLMSGSVRCLVVLLHLVGDMGGNDGLQPLSRSTAANPRMCRGHRASKASGKSGGTQGKAFVPCHGQIIPRKIKCERRKINLAKGYAMRKVFACPTPTNSQKSEPQSKPLAPPIASTSASVESSLLIAMAASKSKPLRSSASGTLNGASIRLPAQWGSSSAKSLDDRERVRSPAFFGTLGIWHRRPRCPTSSGTFRRLPACHCSGS